MNQTVRISTRVRRAIGAITVLLVGATALTAADEHVDAAGPAMTGLHVAGSKLLNGANQEVRPPRREPQLNRVRMPRDRAR